MRRLVVCCDGTWKTYSDDTNVARLHRHLAETDAQVVRYFPGSGTQGTPWGRVLEAGFGTGLAEDVQGVYAWLAATWRPGDEVVLFGFSRGAFTVRSLTGMLTSCGLAQPADPTDDAETAALAERVWGEGYRGGRPVTDVVFHPAFGPDDRAPIAFLGVWDTVGALGVPVTFGFLSALFGRGDVRFRDVVLSPDVRHARQALALDEQRGPFVPAVWPDPSPGTHDSLVQLWFPGGHGDVGGGRPETGLSDAALRWMADEADATVGLTWQDPVTVTGDPTVTVEDGPDGLWRYLSPRPRTVPRVVEGAPAVHPTAVARRAAGLAPPYRPGVVPAPGETHRFDVPADDPWHESGLWLEPGRYRVAVEGTWRDHGASVPATGAGPWPSWPLLSWPAWGLGAALDEVRALARRVTGNARADSLGSRRVADAPWMALVVAVANDRRELDGTLHEGTSLAIDADAESDLDLATAGYLYAFANDAWTGYGSNDGFVSCIITCVSWGFTPTQS